MSETHFSAAETGCIDQDLPAFVVARNGEPVGKMADGDSVILFNFRGDRAQEISMAFDGDASFDKFDRGMVPQVKSDEKPAAPPLVFSFCGKFSL